MFVFDTYLLRIEEATVQVIVLYYSLITFIAHRKFPAEIPCTKQGTGILSDLRRQCLDCAPPKRQKLLCAIIT